MLELKVKFSMLLLFQFQPIFKLYLQIYFGMTETQGLTTHQRSLMQALIKTFQ